MLCAPLYPYRLSALSVNSASFLRRLHTSPLGVSYPPLILWQLVFLIPPQSQTLLLQRGNQAHLQSVRSVKAEGRASTRLECALAEASGKTYCCASNGSSSCCRRKSSLVVNCISRVILLLFLIGSKYSWSSSAGSSCSARSSDPLLVASARCCKIRACCSFSWRIISKAAAAAFATASAAGSPALFPYWPPYDDCDFLNWSGGSGSVSTAGAA